MTKQAKKIEVEAYTDGFYWFFIAKESNAIDFLVRIEKLEPLGKGGIAFRSEYKAGLAIVEYLANQGLSIRIN